MKAYIAGIAGFLGSHLAELLLADGWDVEGCDDLSYGDRGRVPAGVHWWETDAATVRYPDVDVIFNCAGHARTLEVEAHPRIAHHSNVDVACHVASEARRTGARLVHASSCIIYGPDCEYKTQKVAAEAAVAEHDDAVSLQFANLYGRHQSEKGNSPNVLASMKRDARHGYVHVSGDGSQTRDFLHVVDAVHAMWTVATATRVRDFYNVATGTQTSILDAAYQFTNSIIFTPARKMDVPSIVMDTGCMEDDFNWMARVPPLAGIKEYASD